MKMLALKSVIVSKTTYHAAGTCTPNLPSQVIGLISGRKGGSVNTLQIEVYMVQNWSCTF